MVDRIENGFIRHAGQCHLTASNNLYMPSSHMHFRTESQHEGCTRKAVIGSGHLQQTNTYPNNCHTFFQPQILLTQILREIQKGTVLTAMFE